MATVNDVVLGALKLLEVVAAETPMTAAEAEDGRVSLNDMMAEWEERKLHTGFTALSDVDDVLNVQDFAIGAIKAQLALYIAPEYGKTPSDSLERRAIRGLNALNTALKRIDPTQFPDTLPVGSGNEAGYTSSDGDLAGINTETFFPANEKRNF